MYMCVSSKNMLKDNRKNTEGSQVTVLEVLNENVPRKGD